MASDPNLARLEETAERLGPLLDELMLVGGCATGLLVTDPGAAPIRPTVDVDVVVEAASYGMFTAFEARLRDRGFAPGMQPGDPICRWRHGAVVLDLVATHPVQGFTNRWYAPAFARTLRAELPSGAVIRHIDGPHFVAAKLDAFLSRGAGDPVTSHDAEDVVLVVDGRATLLDEVRDATPALRAAVREGLRILTGDAWFMEGLQGYFDPAIARERARVVEERLRTLCDV